MTKSAQNDAIAEIRKTAPHPADVRLECVRMTYRHDRNAPDIIDKASQLAVYVLTGTQLKPPAKAGDKVDKAQASAPT